MTRSRMLGLTFLTVALWGLGHTPGVGAETPKVDQAARQKFVALLTSVRAEAKIKGASRAQKPKGSLRAFDSPPATPARGGRGR